MSADVIKIVYCVSRRKVKLEHSNGGATVFVVMTGSQHPLNGRAEALLKIEIHFSLISGNFQAA